MMIIRKVSIIISTHNYVEQTFRSLQINETLSQEELFTPIWKAVHMAPFLYFMIKSLQTYLLRIMKY